jgi:hypothetical protein
MILTILIAVGFVAGVLAVAAWAARLPREERSFLSNAEPNQIPGITTPGRNQVGPVFRICSPAPPGLA